MTEATLQMRYGQIMLYGLFGTFVLAIVGSIGIEVWGAPRFTADLLVAIMWLLTGAMLPATACAMALERGAPRWLCWSGVIAVVIALPLWIWLFALWDAHSEIAASRITFAAGVMTAWSFASGFAGGLLTVPAVRWWERWLRMVTIALMYLLFGATLLMLLALARESSATVYEHQTDVDRLLRLVGVLGTLFGLTLVGMVLSHYERKLRGSEADVIERRAFGVRCPRCSAEQQLETGGDQCRTCGLKIKVTVT